MAGSKIPVFKEREKVCRISQQKLMAGSKIPVFKENENVSKVVRAIPKANDNHIEIYFNPENIKSEEIQDP